MANTETTDLDDSDWDIDNDLEMAPLDMDAEEPTTDRSAATAVKTHFYDGVLTAATPSQMRETIKAQLPSGIKTAVDEADNLISAGEKAKDSLLTPIRKELPGLKRNLNRLTPMVKQFAGDTLGNKFDEMTKTKAAGTDGPDADTVEMQNGLASVFGVWRDQEIATKEQDLVRGMMTEHTDTERFNMKFRAISELLQEVRRSNAYSTQVDLTWKERILELHYKKYHILRNLLKVSTEGTNQSISELKQITKNTGLPDLVKQQKSETFKQLFLEKWQGKSIDTLQEYGRGYINKFTDNVAKEAASIGSQIADGLSQASDAAGMVADQNDQEVELAEMGMGDSAKPKDLKDVAISKVGGQLGNGLVTKLTEFVTQQLLKHDKIKDVEGMARYAVENKNDLLKDTLAKWANSEKFGSGVGEWLHDRLDVRGDNLETLKSDSLSHSRDAVQLDNAMRDATVTVIPGWLGKIHNRLGDLIDGDNNVEEVYDASRGMFVTKHSAVTNVLNSIATKDDQTTLQGEIDKFKDTLFKGKDDVRSNLTKDDERLLDEQLNYQTVNSESFSPKVMSEAESYNSLDSYTEESAKRVAAAIEAVVGSDDSTIKLNELGKEKIDNRNRVNHGYKTLARSNDLKQDYLNQLSNAGMNDLLLDAGLAKLNANGEMELDNAAVNRHRLGNVTHVGDTSTTDVTNVGDTTINNTSNLEASPIDIQNLNAQNSTNSYGGRRNIRVGGRQGGFVNLGGGLNNFTQNHTANNATGTVTDTAPILSAIERLTNTLTSRNSTNPTLDTTEAIIASKDLLNDISLGILESEESTRTRLDSIIELLSVERNPQGELQPRSEARQSTASLALSDDVVKSINTTPEYLIGILDTLGEMYNANSKYYDADLSSRGVTQAAGTLFAQGIRATTGIAKGMITGIATGGSILKRGLSHVKGLIKPPHFIGDFLSGIKSGTTAMLSKSSDIYIAGETEPRLTSRAIRDGLYFSRDMDTGKVTRIKTIADIQGAVVDKDGNEIISLEEVTTKDLVAKDANGVWKSLGAKVPGVLSVPFTAVGKGVKLGKLIYNLAKRGVTALSKHLSKLKDVHIFDADGKLKLLATVKDIESGKIFVEIDGAKVAVKSLSDLTKGTLYKLNPDTNELEVLATVQELKSGFYDALGKSLKISGLVSKVLGSAINVGWSVAKLPFTILGHSATALKKALTGRFLKSLVLNLPGDVQFKANNVYLLANNIKSGEELGFASEGDSIINNRTTSVSDSVNNNVTSSTTHRNASVSDSNEFNTHNNATANHSTNNSSTESVANSTTSSSVSSAIERFKLSITNLTNEVQGATASSTANLSNVTNRAVVNNSVGVSNASNHSMRSNVTEAATALYNTYLASNATDSPLDLKTFVSNNLREIANNSSHSVSDVEKVFKLKSSLKVKLSSYVSKQLATINNKLNPPVPSTSTATTPSVVAATPPIPALSTFKSNVSNLTRNLTVSPVANPSLKTTVTDLYTEYNKTSKEQLTLKDFVKQNINTISKETNTTVEDITKAYNLDNHTLTSTLKDKFKSVISLKEDSTSIIHSEALKLHEEYIRNTSDTTPLSFKEFVNTYYKDIANVSHTSVSDVREAFNLNVTDKGSIVSKRIERLSERFIGKDDNSSRDDSMELKRGVNEVEKPLKEGGYLPQENESKSPSAPEKAFKFKSATYYVKDKLSNLTSSHTNTDRKSLINKTSELDRSHIELVAKSLHERYLSKGESTLTTQLSYSDFVKDNLKEISRLSNSDVSTVKDVLNNETTQSHSHRSVLSAFKDRVSKLATTVTTKGISHTNTTNDTNTYAKSNGHTRDTRVLTVRWYNRYLKNTTDAVPLTLPEFAVKYKDQIEKSSFSKDSSTIKELKVEKLNNVVYKTFEAAKSKLENGLKGETNEAVRRAALKLHNVYLETTKDEVPLDFKTFVTKNADKISKVSKHSVSEVNKVFNSSSTIREKVASIFTKVKSKRTDVKEDVKAEEDNAPVSAKSAGNASMEGVVPKGGVLSRLKATLTRKKPGKADKDGDGLRDGGWIAKIKARRAARKEAKEDKARPNKLTDTVKSNKGLLGGLVAGGLALVSMMGGLGGVISTVTTGFSILATGVKGLYKGIKGLIKGIGWLLEKLGMKAPKIPTTPTPKSSSTPKGKSGPKGSTPKEVVEGKANTSTSRKARRAAKRADRSLTKVKSKFTDKVSKRVSRVKVSEGSELGKSKVGQVVRDKTAKLLKGTTTKVTKATKVATSRVAKTAVGKAIKAKVAKQIEVRAAKRVAKIAAKKVAVRVAKKIGVKAVAKVLLVGAGAFVTSPVAVFVLTGYAVWETISLAIELFGYFHRRSDIEAMEKSRLLSYGFLTGNDGQPEQNKVTLRYFESEMLSNLINTKGVIDFKDSPSKIFDDYGEEFGCEGTEIERSSFITWFEFRFKPVFFKWLKLTSVYNEARKAEEGRHVSRGGYRPLSLNNLDELLNKTQRSDFLKQAVTFDEVPHDPLAERTPPSPSMLIEALRAEVLKYNENYLVEETQISIIAQTPGESKKELAKKAQDIKDGVVTAKKRSKIFNKIKEQSREGLGVLKPEYLNSNSPVNTDSSGKSYSDTFGTNGSFKFSKFVPVTEIDHRIAKYDSIIEAAATKYKVDPMLIRAIIKQESQGKVDAQSYVGAKGLMQLMDPTAKDLGVTDPFDPVQNINAGTKYIAGQIRRFKDPTLALMAYNMGGGNLSANIRRAGSNDPDDVINHLHSFTTARNKRPHESIGYVEHISKNYLDYTNTVLSDKLQEGPGGTIAARASGKWLPKQSDTDNAKVAEDRSVASDNGIALTPIRKPTDTVAKEATVPVMLQRRSDSPINTRTTSTSTTNTHTESVHTANPLPATPTVVDNSGEINGVAHAVTSTGAQQINVTAKQLLQMEKMNTNLETLIAQAKVPATASVSSQPNPKPTPKPRVVDDSNIPTSLSRKY